MIRIVVLDDYVGLAAKAFGSLNPSKFSVSYFPDTLPAYALESTTDDCRSQLLERLVTADVISTMRERTPFPAELVDRLPNLRLLLTTSRRNLALHLPSFKARSIPVTGTEQPRSNGGYGTDSTTQHTIALVLALARGIPASVTSMANGGWQTRRTMAVGLGNKTLGVIGLGRLGTSVARGLHLGLGMKVIAWSPNLTQAIADERAREAGLPVEDQASGRKTFCVVSREELFRESDVVSIHLVLSDSSRGSITVADLSLMKPSAFFVNTSRGPLVCERDLLSLLKQGRIAGAALDVFDTEPLPQNSEWRTIAWGEDGRSEVIITPHVGYMERDVLESWYEQQVENLLAWDRGDPLKMRLV
ncbi:hypothetical protein BROUX41_001727 [Berkeleyomyces rouxiae]